MRPREKKQAVERDYVGNVGHEPRNLPEDHPDRWQWEYVGGREDREQLLDRLAGNDLAGNDLADTDDEGPSQEETLW